MHPDKIKILPGRQRHEAAPDHLIESIRRRGIINPIVVTEDGTLIAGECRLLAAKALGLKSVPVRKLKNLTPVEAAMVELDENLHRKDLTWQEQCNAVQSIANQLDNPTPKDLADILGLSESTVRTYLSIQKEMEATPEVAEAKTLREARNKVKRQRERRKQAVLTDIVVETTKAAPAEADPGITLYHGDFLRWLEAPTRMDFNFIHVDFPYGVSFGQGARRPDKATLYEDSPELFRELTIALFENLTKITAPTVHIMFWFGIQNYEETLELIRQHAPLGLYVNPIPLIWLKSDGAGMFPDPKRKPRQVYEAAFICTLGDRFIVKMVANAIASPSGRGGQHASHKTDAVLSHFFQLFVDENTIMLDPTCGSGQALITASRLGAKACVGIELDERHVETARLTTKLPEYKELPNA